MPWRRYDMDLDPRVSLIALVVFFFLILLSSNFLIQLGIILLLGFCYLNLTSTRQLAKIMVFLVIPTILIIILNWIFAVPVRLDLAEASSVRSCMSTNFSSNLLKNCSAKRWSYTKFWHSYNYYIRKSIWCFLNPCSRKLEKIPWSIREYILNIRTRFLLETAAS